MGDSDKVSGQKVINDTTNLLTADRKMDFSGFCGTQLEIVPRTFQSLI